MARALIVFAAFLTLAVPVALAVPPADKPEKPDKSTAAPGQSAEKNRAKACKAERGTTAQSIDAFKERYGTNANKANAFGKCVSGKAKAKKDKANKDDDAEDAAEEAAAKKCKAERGTTAQSIDAFKQKHGTNKNKANAFGKCVSKLAKKATTS